MSTTMIPPAPPSSPRMPDLPEPDSCDEAWRDATEQHGQAYAARYDRMSADTVRPGKAA